MASQTFDERDLLALQSRPFPGGKKHTNGNMAQPESSRILEKSSDRLVISFKDRSSSQSILNKSSFPPFKVQDLAADLNPPFNSTSLATFDPEITPASLRMDRPINQSASIKPSTPSTAPIPSNDDTLPAAKRARTAYHASPVNRPLPSRAVTFAIDYQLIDRYTGNSSRIISRAESEGHFENGGKHELTLALKVSKDYLTLVDRPSIDMEKEMGLCKFI